LTKRLFWDDAYMKEFDATVLSVEGDRVVLDKTAFNPRGGGLVSDTGTLGASKVMEAVKEGEEIFHVLDSTHGLVAGRTIHGSVDWATRYRVMKMHTAAHILSAVVNRETGALITGNQIAPDESRVDLSLQELDRDRLSYYVDRVNQEAARGLEVRAFFMKREQALATPGLVKLANAMPPSLESLRIVQIGDVDTQADGGVHVRNTSEIGKVLGLKVENKGKSNRRLYFTVE
jgi:misacylated tRNA(Ala) deacylase